jgi:hypothetical protein
VERVDRPAVACNSSGTGGDHQRFVGDASVRKCTDGIMPYMPRQLWVRCWHVKRLVFRTEAAVSEYSANTGIHEELELSEA